MPKGRQANSLSKARAFATYEVHEEDRNAVEIGRVKFFDHRKGFGFIQPDDRNKEAVFIAGKIVARAGLEILYSGDRLEYTRIADRFGRADTANRIRLLVKEVAQWESC